MKTITELTQRLLDLRDRREQAEEEVERLKTEYGLVMSELMEQFGMEDIENIKQHGHLFYKQLVFWPKVENPEVFEKWCERHGRDKTEFMMFSAQRLRKYCREACDSDLPYPEGVTDRTESERYEIRIRKS